MTVAEVRPLRLRQERVQPKPQISEDLPYASILVDHGIFHMDSIYDYLVPARMNGDVLPGQLVEVPFNQKKKLGIVLSRSSHSTITRGFKEISQCLTRLPYCSNEQLDLFRKAAELYGAKEWDFIRSAIPAFSKSGERAYISSISSNQPEASSAKWSSSLPLDLASYLDSEQKIAAYIQLPVFRPYWEVLSEIVLTRANLNVVLLIVPTERERNLMERTLIDRGASALIMKSDDAKSHRYQSYLQATLGQSPHPRIIVGTRSSVFMDLPPDSTIVIFNDQDESHYERRSPTWNSRNVALLRLGECSVIFTSLSPSLEIVDSISRKLILHYTFSHKRDIKFMTQEGVQGDFFPVISSGLKRGSVLVCVGNTGYVNSFACQKCRNTAVCDCGGKLSIVKEGAVPTCTVCAQKYPGWKCTWCGETKPRTITTGLLRKGDELGRAFPKTPVVMSHGEDSTPYLPSGNHLVVSTYGVEPRGQYAAIVFLDMEQQASRADLRGLETIRENIFRNLSMIENGGEVYLSLPAAHALSQDVIKISPYRAAEREVDERNAAHLPPNYDVIQVIGSSTGNSVEGCSTVIRELEKELEFLEIIGPYQRDKQSGTKSLLIKCLPTDRHRIISRLSEINRVNSLRSAPLFTMKLDPFSLS